MDKFPLEANIENIKILAEQMVKRKFESGEYSDASNKSDSQEKNNTIPNAEDNLCRNGNELQLAAKLSISKSNSNKLITETNINTNINSVQNTGPNYNTINININNDCLNDEDSKLYQLSESINNSTSNEANKYKRDENYQYEIVDPNLLKEELIDSSDEFENFNNKINNNQKKTKMKKNIYEREMNHLKRQKEKLEKKRKKIENDEIKELKPGPGLNPVSRDIIEKRIQYIPLEKRVPLIQSMKETKGILNRENKRIKEYNEDMIELNKNVSKHKNFDEEEWDKFVNRQNQWKNEKLYKIKAANILRDNVSKKIFFKPKINENSKQIIKDIQNGNENMIDEVYIRLFNDYEEHKQRQNLRNEQSLPSFHPKLATNPSRFKIGNNSKIPNRCSTNPVIWLNELNLKNKYDFSDKKEENKIDDIQNKVKSQKILLNPYENEIRLNDNNKSQSCLNNIKKSEQKPMEMKTQGPTQPTNLNTNINYTEGTSDLVNSKYLFVDKSWKKSEKNNILNNNTNNKKKKVFLPLNIKNMIQKNCNEEPNDILKEDLIIKESNNNKEDSSENKNIKNNNYYNTENNIESKSDDEDYKIEESEEEEKNSKKKLPNINNINIFDNLKEGEKKEIINNMNKNNNKESYNNLYKLNVCDSTPHLIKQDIVLSSKNYSDIFKFK